MRGIGLAIVEVIHDPHQPTFVVDRETIHVLDGLAVVVRDVGHAHHHVERYLSALETDPTPLRVHPARETTGAAELERNSVIAFANHMVVVVPVVELPGVEPLDAEQGVHQIDLVVHVVKKQAACMLPVVVRGVVGKVEVETDDPSKPCEEPRLIRGTHTLEKPQERPVPTPWVARSEDEPLLRRVAEQRLQVEHALPRHHERLLAEHVLAGLEGHLDLLEVELVRRTDEDRVDPLFSEKRLERTVLLGTPDPLHRVRIRIPDAIGADVRTEILGVVL